MQRVIGKQRVGASTQGLELKLTRVSGALALAAKLAMQRAFIL
jgi:hypothetical protein